MKARTIKRIGTEVVELRYAGEIDWRFCAQTLDDLKQSWPTAGSNRLLLNFTSAWPSPSAFAVRGQGPFVESLSQVRCAARMRVALLNPIDVGLDTDAVLKRARITLRHFHDRDVAIEWLTA